MSRQIIKQPNGKYCVFSSIVDNVIMVDATEDEIIDKWVSEQKREIESNVKSIISDLNNEGKPYYQFTMSYEEMLRLIEEIHK